MRSMDRDRSEERVIVMAALALAVGGVAVIGWETKQPAETTGAQLRTERAVPVVSEAQQQDAIYAGALERAYNLLCGREPPDRSRLAVAQAIAKAGVAGDARIAAKATEIAARERADAARFCVAAEWVFLSLDARLMGGR